MYGKNCKECGKATRIMDYCKEHYDKEKMISVFKKSSKKHLERFDRQKKQHQKRGIIENLFDEMYEIYTKILKLA